MQITNDILYVGVNDHKVDLFEGQYVVPNGMAYNSYVIRDEKTAVMDTVDAGFTKEWLDNIAAVLGDAKPDYLVVQHMEPDHAANIENFMKVYPETTIVANTKTFGMMKNFFRDMDLEGRTLEVGNGESLTLGKHVLTFVFAPMVHWPEVMVTYDSTDKVLFSADGFGKFGALDVEEDWDCEARRYYIGIVGKYGPQVQKLLKAAATLDIQIICPLHGYYNKIIFDYNLSNFFEIPARHDGAGGIVWKWQDKDLGALRDCSTQVISGQTEFILGFEIDEFRYAVCHNCTRFIGNERWLRNQNLITRLEHGTHGKVNRLAAAYSYKNLCFWIIGNMIFILYIFADLLAEFQKTCV